jgi:PIN domain nuclease of toxin-antitoxin system
MRIIIDTCIFLWFIENNPKLSSTALSLIEDKGNDILLSLTSIWEIAIKYSIGKLIFTKAYDIFIREQIDINSFDILPINFDHISTVAVLPLHHRDPFDRMIISQAIVEGLPIISSDTAFDDYPIKRLW